MRTPRGVRASGAGLAAMGIRTASFTLVAITGCSPGTSPPEREVVLAKHERLLPALDEMVAFVMAQGAHGGTFKYAIRADGRRQSVRAPLEAEMEAHLARFGKLDLNLYGKLAELAPTERMRIAIAYDPGIDWADLEPRLQNTDESERQQASSEVRERLSDEAASLIQDVEASGGMNVRSAGLVPLVFADLTRAQAEELARHGGGITRMTASSRGKSPALSPPSTAGNSITVPGVDQVFNPSITGDGQAIGLIEDAGCRLFLEHDALQGVDIQTQDLSMLPPCSTHVGCQNQCGSGDSFCDLEGASATFQCIDSHVGSIASTVAQRLGMTGDFGAWEATIYHPTRGDGSAIACSEEGIANAYDWLESRTTPSVGVTSESFGCEDGDGLAQEYYARNHGFTVFRAAGEGGLSSSTLAGCRPMNSICVGGMQPASGGGYEMYLDSSALNPSTPNDDREEPDIVALADNVDVILIVPPDPGNPPDTSSWMQDDGTSFAAPAMATMAVLMREVCNLTNPRLVRAVMMTSAWSINPEGPPYSTPQAGQDYEDGAGAPTADNLIKFCPGSGSELTVGTGTGTADKDDGEDAPPWMEEGDSGFAGGAPPLQPLGPNPGGLAYQIKELEEFELRGGDRIRIVFTWDSCPGSSPVGTGPAPLEADMDLFLCDWSKETCLAKSRSFDNNVEGFDVEVPSGTDLATYTLHYGWDPDSPFCDGGGEPWGYAWVYGRASSF